MTIEEKAEEYRSDIFGTPFGKDVAMAFSEGAEWMLGKVMDLLEGCEVVDRLGGRPVKIEDFKKALEE